MEKKRNKMSFYKSIIKKMRKDKSEMHIIDAKNEKITREICTKEILDLLDAPGGKSWGDGAEGKFDEEMAKNSIVVRCRKRNRCSSSNILQIRKSNWKESAS